MSEKPLSGYVAMVTGAARGQGASHALRLAREGCAVLAVDICHEVTGNLPPRAHVTTSTSS